MPISRHAPTPTVLRLCIQTLFALACLWIGYRFVLFLNWAAKGGQPMARPAGVEGFLPISALLGLKKLMLTGRWDVVHPAGLTILIMALAMSLLLRKGFCGYVCPMGLVSHLLERTGRALGLARRMPPLAARVLGVPKYLLLGFFCFTIFAMPAGQLEEFLRSPYNMVADARLLDFFRSPSLVSLLILGGLVLLSMVVRNAWCRFLCPYGALLGILALASPLSLRRDPTTCVDCGKCRTACPSAIDVPARTTVNSTLCLGCMQCAGACPVPDCLTPRLFGQKRVSLLLAGIGVAVLFLLVWSWAAATGHWDNGMPTDMIRAIYRRNLGV